MTRVKPLSEEELQKLIELQELQKRQEAYEHQQAMLEAKAERDKFNAKCKSVFGYSKKQIDDKLAELDSYKELIERLRKCFPNTADWTIEKYVARAESRVSQVS